jgi:hypothetical protein
VTLSGSVQDRVGIVKALDVIVPRAEEFAQQVCNLLLVIDDKNLWIGHNSPLFFTRIQRVGAKVRQAKLPGSRAKKTDFPKLTQKGLFSTGADGISTRWRLALAGHLERPGTNRIVVPLRQT